MKRKPKVTRPPSFTPEVEATLIAMLGEGRAQHEIAAATKLHEININQWISKGRKSPRGPFGKLAKAADKASALKRANILRRKRAEIATLEVRLRAKKKALEAMLKKGG
jgi:hypothetical protein